MSIFPKKTAPGKPVTIHWNFVPTGITAPFICPHVRIGVIDPAGNTTILFEQHIVAIAPPLRPSTTPFALPLKKETPLLVLASYLQFRSGKQQFKEILERMDTGTHRYFIYHTPPDALPGRYVLLSELFIDGALKHSLTREDDFFLVEQLVVELVSATVVLVKNLSPEPCHAELITLRDGQSFCNPVVIEGCTAVDFTITAPTFLCYNEGKETIALHSLDRPLYNRNQQMITLPPQAGSTAFHVMHAGEPEGFLLEDAYAAIWDGANGFTNVLQPEAPLAEMIDAGLIVPMNEFTVANHLNPSQI